MLKNSILLISLSLALGACTVNTKTEEVAPPGTNDKTGGGPYAVDFTSSPDYQHQFRIPINQAEGKVEYFIKTNEAEDIEFVSTNLKVSGCSASQVSHNVLWIPDSNTVAGQYVVPGSTFKTRAGVQGTFMHVLRGLSGCLEVDLTTNLKKKPKSSMACKESKDPQCRVEVYCKETDPLKSFYEVEVWKQSWGTTLQMYMNRGDGTRGLMASHTVTFSSNGNESTYIGNGAGDRTFLKYNNQNLRGLYSQQLSSGTHTIDLNCKLP